MIRTLLFLLATGLLLATGYFVTSAAIIASLVADKGILEYLTLALCCSVVGSALMRLSGD